MNRPGGRGAGQPCMAGEPGHGIIFLRVSRPRTGGTGTGIDECSVTGSMQFKHVALSVAEIECSIAFYRDLLGFKVVLRLECPPEQGLGKVVGLPGCSALIAHLQLGGAMLELFEYLDPRGKPIPPHHTQADNGFTHLGFASDDIHADYERLKSNGVKFYGQPVECRPSVWNAYFYGPDGETYELR